MRATVRYVEDMCFLGTSESNHNLIMDVTTKTHEQTAPSPLEAMLMSLGSCSAVDVVVILEKKRVAYDLFEVRMDAKRRDEHPRILTDIALDYHFRGRGLEEQRKQLEDTVRLSEEKYCSVAGMLSNQVKLTWKVTIEEP